MTDNTSRPEWVPPEGGREFACYVRPGVNNPGGDPEETGERSDAVF